MTPRRPGRSARPALALMGECQIISKNNPRDHLQLSLLRHNK
ncbi:hypothetical protein FTUN_7217 [Frigoriglobus tundricola]|uniref:Uncharacterized protein n=1 Tax=Frigoriglobus tundricola TaxID=2774151 RepID=A0A6M5Z085_9BACT|nr:hypothetical protein FTUN_7217 [Frigoriglobus tundricola]